MRKARLSCASTHLSFKALFTSLLLLAPSTTLASVVHDIHQFHGIIPRQDTTPTSGGSSPSASASPSSSDDDDDDSPSSTSSSRSSSTSSSDDAEESGGGGNGSTEIRVRNNCGETIWPGVGTQAGKGPVTSGFELKPGSVRSLSVSEDWQGRVWGRTNCSFNADGTRSSNGRAQACETGDCGGVLNCVNTGMTPVTLFEIALQGGSEGVQSFYDISLVDGYNLPMGVVYLKSSGAPDLPPNLTNCRCVASEGHTGGGSANESFPMPEASGGDLGRWCPWDHQLSPPTKPGDGVYPYPDDDIKRPNFSPCLSACELTKSDKDCCKGEFNSPDICKPGMYSNQAKAVCPDAYSFAFDDQSSTFIVPTGGGWEVTFCPGGASTNILRTFSKELFDLASGNVGSEDLMEMARHWQTVKVSDGSTTADRERVASLGALVVLVAFAVLW